MKSNHVRYPFGEDSRGASMLEFAITLPIFLVTIVAILDFTQVMTVQALLDEAASRTLIRATTVPNFDINPKSANPNAVEFKRLVKAREKSLATGMGFMNAVRLLHPEGSTEQTGNMATLMNLRYTEDQQSGAAVDFTSGVMVLLPGDCAQVVSTSQVFCNRQTLGIADNATRPTGEPAVLMRNHPLRAIAVAQVNGYLPFWGNRLIMGEAFGYRQPIPQGPFPAFEDPELSAASGPPAAEVPPPVLGAPEVEPPPAASCVVDAALCVQASNAASTIANTFIAFCPNRAAPGPGSCPCAPAFC